MVTVRAWLGSSLEPLTRNHWELILNTVFEDTIQVYFHVFIYERSMVLQVNKLLQEHLAMNGILILLKHEIRLEIVLLIKFKYSQMYHMFTRFFYWSTLLKRYHVTETNEHFGSGSFGILPSGIWCQSALNRFWSRDVDHMTVFDFETDFEKHNTIQH